MQNRIIIHKRTQVEVADHKKKLGGKERTKCKRSGLKGTIGTKQIAAETPYVLQIPIRLLDVFFYRILSLSFFLSTEPLVSFLSSNSFFSVPFHKYDTPFLIKDGSIRNKNSGAECVPDVEPSKGGMGGFFL